MSVNVQRLVNRFKSDDGVVDRGEAKRLVSRIKRDGVQHRELMGVKELARSSLTRPAARYIDEFVQSLAKAAKG